MPRRSRATLALSAAVVIASCTSTSEAPSTTVAATVTTMPATTTMADTTTTTVPVAISQVTPPRYQIVSRAETEGNGDEVVVLLDPTSYETLTDIDIYDVIVDVVELFPPVTVLHVVDDAGAATVMSNPEATDDERVAAAPHYLARLEDGYRVVYLGRFAGTATAVLGS